MHSTFNLINRVAASLNVYSSVLVLAELKTRKAFLVLAEHKSGLDSLEYPTTVSRVFWDYSQIFFCKE